MVLFWGVRVEDVKLDVLVVFGCVSGVGLVFRCEILCDVGVIVILLWLFVKVMFYDL